MFRKTDKFHGGRYQNMYSQYWYVCDRLISADNIDQPIYQSGSNIYANKSG